MFWSEGEGLTYRIVGEASGEKHLVVPQSYKLFITQRIKFLHSWSAYQDKESTPPEAKTPSPPPQHLPSLSLHSYSPAGVPPPRRANSPHSAPVLTWGREGHVGHSDQNTPRHSAQRRNAATKLKTRLIERLRWFCQIQEALLQQINNKPVQQHIRFRLF